MTFRVRPARGEDSAAIYEMAELTGGGFTNLPADTRRSPRSWSGRTSFLARSRDEQAADLYVFVLEDPKTKAIRGTCQIFGEVGIVQPFYSYQLSTLTQTSPELGKTFRNQLLSLTTDLEGCSEVGGLFLHPEARRRLGQRCSHAAAICSSSATGHASASRSWPSCAESSTTPAIRHSGMRLRAGSST